LSSLSPMALRAQGPTPMIGVSPASLEFQAFQGCANVGGYLEIRNVGGGVLNWSVTADAPWLSLSPTSGSSTGEIDKVTVYVDIAGLSLGQRTATIRINAPGVGNAPQTVPVILNVVLGFPAENVEVVGRALGGGTYGVAVQGNRAYLATGFGLMIMDITHPAGPTPMARVYLPDRAYGVAVLGNLAYVADWEAGLQIIDVSNPASPFRRGSFGTPGWAYDVAVLGNLAYVADEGAGLFILRYVGPSSPSAFPGSRDVAAQKSPWLLPDRLNARPAQPGRESRNRARSLRRFGLSP